MKTFSVFEASLWNRGHGRLQLPALSVHQAETAPFSPNHLVATSVVPQRTEQPPSKSEGSYAAGQQLPSYNLGVGNYIGQGGKSLLDPLRSWPPATVRLHLMQSSWRVGLRQTRRRQGSTNSSNRRGICFITLCCKRARVLQGQTTAICRRRAFRALNSNCAPAESPFRLVLESNSPI